MATVIQTAAASRQRSSRPRSAAPSASDTLRKRALEKLTDAIAAAVATASDATLADIVGSSDLRHALTIAPRDLAPPPPERLVAIRAARERTSRFREDMAVRAGGMLDRTQVADLLGLSMAAIDKQRQRNQILGVPYGSDIRYPAAQFANGETVGHLKAVLVALGDTDPWEKLQLLTTPLEGFRDASGSILELLADRPDPETLRQITGLVAGWAT